MRNLSRYPLLILAALLTCLCFASNLLAQAEFPLRGIYPEVGPITTDELIQQYDNAVVVDIRTAFEYNVAHVNSAVLLPMSQQDFPELLEKTRAKDDPRPMVFYCNGHTCAKSYKAAQLALSLGFENVFVYDGGIFDWIEAAPDKATLMGVTPADGEMIIPELEFASKVLPFEDFKNGVEDENAICIDIRDPFQREMAPDIDGVRNIPLDPLLELITSRIWSEKKLYFFDAVGKQVRWLQYFLKTYDYLDYRFLDGGMLALMDDPDQIRPVNAGGKDLDAFQDILKKASVDDSLSSTSIRVMLYVLSCIKFNNYAAIDGKDMVRDLRMDRESLSIALKQLDRRNYLISSYLEGTYVIQVNPELAWKGDIESSLRKEKILEFTLGGTTTQ